MWTWLKRWRFVWRERHDREIGKLKFDLARLEWQLEEQVKKAKYWEGEWQKATAVIQIPQDLLEFKPVAKIRLKDSRYTIGVEFKVIAGRCEIQMSPEFTITQLEEAARQIEMNAWRFIDDHVRGNLGAAIRKGVQDIMKLKGWFEKKE